MANKSSPTTAASAAAWSSFSVVTAATIIIFWVLFPFYSYQLQIIFDQKFCSDPEKTDQYEYCYLPSKQNALPYCPDTECKETVEGPDMFTKFFSSFGEILKQIYTIITGVVWIEIDKSVTKMEHDLHNPKPKKEDKPTKTSSSQGSIDKPVADAIEAVADFETKVGGALVPRVKKTIKKLGNTIKKAVKSPVKTVICSEKLGNDKSCRDDSSGNAAIKEALKILTSTSSLHINRKNFVNMAFCKISGTDMSTYYDASLQKHVKDSKGGFSIFDFPPFSYIIPKKFGWPYTYLFNEGVEETRYSPDNDKGEKSNIRWVGAWFAKTQQRSWSTMRNLWSMILGLFLPFLEDEVTYDDIEEKLEAFIKALDNALGSERRLKETILAAAPKTTSSPAAAASEQNTDFGGGGTKTLSLLEISKKFKIIHNVFKDKEENIKNKDISARVALFGVMKGDIEEDKDKQENIYLRFFVAAVRNTKYEGSRWLNHSIGLGGNARYWMRYIITWYIPMLTMVTMGITMFLGFWMTALSSINRYSSIILPFFFGFVTSLYNMFALPASLFSYFIMGGMGRRPKSKNCPYDSGVYQMRRNFWQYLPLNLYLTLGIISMQLGPTLAATGKPTAGIILTFLFPGLFLLVFLYRILSALSSLM